MKTLIFLITIIAATSLVRPNENEEIIWEVDVKSGLGELILSPLGEIFYNTRDSIVQIRSVENGALIDEIDIDIFKEDIKSLSISNDGRYLALSGDTPYAIIYDLFEKKEINRLTTVVYERQEGDRFVVYNTDKWVSSSISPDGTKLLGVAKNEDVYDKTNLVVIEIETGEVLFEERRISYDTFNPSDNSPEWKFTNYSPDGSKIVAQLEFRSPNPKSSDSIYIFKSFPITLDTIISNSYNYNFLFSFSSDNKYLAFKAHDNVGMYRFDERIVINNQFPDGVFEILFSRESPHFIYGYRLYNKIFNFLNIEEVYEYSFPIVPKFISLNNRTFVGKLNNKIYSLKTFFELTNIDEADEYINLLSPNPTTGDINIKLNNQIPSNFNYELISLSGQIVKTNLLGFISHNNQNISLNISEVANGQYTLRIYNEQEEFSFSIIKEG